uniref:C2 domain-containing protein n=1 Tax=Steinernema glaseri TaxID=37863 RepID=A0A1I7ZE05_9BILA
MSPAPHEMSARIRVLLPMLLQSASPEPGDPINSSSALVTSTSGAPQGQRKKTGGQPSPQFNESINEAQLHVSACIFHFPSALMRSISGGNRALDFKLRGVQEHSTGRESIPRSIKANKGEDESRRRNKVSALQGFP